LKKKNFDLNPSSNSFLQRRLSHAKNKKISRRGIFSWSGENGKVALKLPDVFFVQFFLWILEKKLIFFCCDAADGQEALRTASTKLHRIRGPEDGRLLTTSDAESRKILLNISPANSAAPSRVTSSAHLSSFLERERVRKVSPPSSTSAV
jgi:hypothetical protein